jgi:fructosamine-3-kinase
MIPLAVQAAVEHELSVLEGRPVRMARSSPVGGGCISPGACFETTDSCRYFLKCGERGAVPTAMFQEEARSLDRLRETGSIRVPGVVARAETWLLLEWLEPGKETARTWQVLGRQLAALHQHKGDSFGWDADNFIGTLPQPNGGSARWPPFWSERRLLPQFERAARKGYIDVGDRRSFDRLLTHLDDLVSAGDHDGPSLLHGDLWGGNAHIMADGEPALIDPSSYYGHREVDLAMAALFGGFPQRFFRAYAEAWPLEPGFEQTRCELYQLYYLLVHVNLFGHSYVAGTRRILRRFGG